ncbi:hypothetical protein CCS41_11660 [Candidatus Fukatsuia symbiotica]|uniref:Uncharacterized protein n=1 Tax=Candidatus Fukatsuia symbiotica TaxID=1878942 RepID=A0A2U8I6Q1_9GAMM|nr:hypothetical protein CCS41_10615 [Candidatus Fukatsuia symbiotica]AWK14973.1 hypothetical protein CCS41_11660 [Candidatus Fukatsuia symbiotica]
MGMSGSGKNFIKLISEINALKSVFLKQRAYYHQKRQVQFTQAVMVPGHRPKELIDFLAMRE